jgi:hypothetical protein
MKKLMLVAVLFTVVFASCKKESCPAPAAIVAPTYPIEGYWTGLYGNGTGVPNVGYSMVVEAGGKIVVSNAATINGGSNATGNYIMTGNVFKGTYTYPSGGGTFSFQGTFNNAGKLENGTWGNGTNTTNGGLWFMDRKN